MNPSPGGASHLQGEPDVPCAQARVCAASKKVSSMWAFLTQIPAKSAILGVQIDR